LSNRRLKIPKKIRVFGRDVTIQEKEIVVDDFGRVCSGTYDDDDGVIEITSKGSNRLREVTILHELGHAIISELGLNEVVSEEVNEMISEGFAKGFSRLFDFRFK